MSDTGLSSIPGKVCSIPIYRSKETTMRFFINSCTSCCSITTPRRPAGSHQALITLWLPCCCGRGIILSTLLQANSGELKVLKLQKGQQLQVRVTNIIRSGGCL